MTTSTSSAATVASGFTKWNAPAAAPVEANAVAELRAELAHVVREVRGRAKRAAALRRATNHAGNVRSLAC